MSQNEWKYYLPRRKYIDKQPLKPSLDYLSQIDLIIKGSRLREKNIWNEVEILKLEEFLSEADDIELSKYFSQSEEIFLGMKAESAIKSIQKLAYEDEVWRKKNDPVFANYLVFYANPKEKIFYSKNKGLFFRKESGEELIEILKKNTK